MYRAARLIATSVLLVLGFAASGAKAQFPAEQVLSGVVQQLQTGRLDPAWYSAQVWQLLSTETNGSGRFPGLAQLGPVTNVAVNRQQELSQGMMFSMTAQHQAGTSNWLLGISTVSTRIELLGFNLGGGPLPLPAASSSPAAPVPGPPGPSLGGPSGPSTSPAPAAPGQPSTACQRFPNLC